MISNSDFSGRMGCGSLNWQGFRGEACVDLGSQGRLSAAGGYQDGRERGRGSRVGGRAGDGDRAAAAFADLRVAVARVGTCGVAGELKKAFWEKG
jgi:hypothetical protein